MPSFDELEQQAEQRISAKLGRYAAAAPMIGWVFAVLLAVYAVVNFSGGALVASLFCVATALLLVWLVALIRTARAALGAPPIT